MELRNMNKITEKGNNLVVEEDDDEEEFEFK